MISQENTLGTLPIHLCKSWAHAQKNALAQYCAKQQRARELHKGHCGPTPLRRHLAVLIIALLDDHAITKIIM